MEEFIDLNSISNGAILAKRNAERGILIPRFSRSLNCFNSSKNHPNLQKLSDDLCIDGDRTLQEYEIKVDLCLNEDLEENSSAYYNTGETLKNSPSSEDVKIEENDLVGEICWYFLLGI